MVWDGCAEKELDVNEVNDRLALCDRLLIGVCVGTYLDDVRVGNRDALSDDVGV